MCRSMTSGCDARRCKNAEQERIAKANYRAGKKLTTELTPKLSAPPKAPSKIVQEIPTVVLTPEARREELLDVIESIQKGEVRAGEGLVARNERLTAAYVELGAMISEEVMTPELQTMLEEAKTHQEGLSKRVVELNKLIADNLKEVSEASDEERAELQEKGAQMMAEYDDIVAQRKQSHPGLDAYFTARREAYRSQLEEVGVEFATDETVTCDPSSNRRAVKEVNSTLRYFPKAWIEKINADTPVLIKETSNRAHYVEQELTTKSKMVQEAKLVVKPADWEPDPLEITELSYERVPVGEYGEATYIHPITGKSKTIEVTDDSQSVWVAHSYTYYPAGETPDDLSKWEAVQAHKVGYKNGESTSEIITRYRKPLNKREEVEVKSSPVLYVQKPNPSEDRHRFGATSAHSVALHELTHRVESLNPELKMAQRSFLSYRAKLGTPDAEDPIEIANGEYGYKDNFANHYTGRDYGGTFYEVLTTGLEGLWFGKDDGHDRITYGADHEFRDFLVGVLASTAKRGER